MSNANSKIKGIILAAGASKRMGAVKALLPFGNSLLLERVIENVARSMLQEAVVVLGHEAETIRRKIDFREFETVINADYQKGLSSSLRAGLCSIRDDIDGAMFLLGDQPFVDAKIIDALVRVFGKHPSDVIIPTHLGRRGNPVVVPRALFPMVKGITGDTGARVLFGRLKNRIREVDVANPGIHLDLDTMEDYRELSASVMDHVKPQPEEIDMCQNCCQQPKKLMDKPENCTPEQIKECHGDTKEHPCTKDNCAPESQ